MSTKTNFQQLIEKVKKDQPKLHERSLQSLDWYRKKIEKDFGNASESPLNVYETEAKTRLRYSGQLMTFRYFPKNKQTLSFYDQYPLILTLDVNSTSVLGLNFHYIKPLHRVIFMDELYKYMATRFNEPYFRIDYTRLVSRMNLKYYKPCIKRYLFANISQKISILDEEDWELALFLPTEKFVSGSGKNAGSANKQKIWSNSEKIIRKR